MRKKSTTGSALRQWLIELTNLSTLLLTKFNYSIWLVNVVRRYILKKYCYTINHKRLGLNYFYFSLITGLSGALLATAIRIEMAYPGSPFFGGDSLKYLQVITAHALIMIFFVVVPIFFGGFANFLLPYHVGSKDVAFPRLNSLGFWIQPCGYLLIAKIGFIRGQFWTNSDKTVNYFTLRNNKSFTSGLSYDILWDETLPVINTYTGDTTDFLLRNQTRPKEEIIRHFYPNFYSIQTLEMSKDVSWKVFFWKYIYLVPNSFWFLVYNARDLKRQKRHIVKCASASQTVAGWTFITPFSSKLKFTGAGVQDMLILGVYFAGISTTISLINLLATRRILAMPGLRNRRILLPFTSIAILLMLRALAVITPVLGSAMLMMLLDRHWQTSFFDFAYGGDPIFFHHLFWFFGHPEVYVLVIPAFGVVNSVLPSINYRRVASKHHLIWAIYIMNYMGFLVWGHHMYLIGLDHRSRALYSTITIMISMPATIKVVNWTFTLVNGALKNDLVFLATISFILFFLVAGFTGMWLSHVSLNISMHDTLYVVAHFHLMLSGAVLMGVFVGFYFYFLSFFQVKYSQIFGYIHIFFYTGGQWLTFIPLFWVSFSGLPRRLHDFPAIYMGWQSMATAGHFVTMLGVTSFYCMLLDSHLEKKITIFLHTIIPRFNKRALYYLGKIVNFRQHQKQFSLVPKASAQKLLQTHTHYWYVPKYKKMLYTMFKLFVVWLISFIKLLICFLIFTLVIATVTLIERKLLALVQRRVGPQYVGYKGRLQFIADALKLLFKHIVIVSKITRVLVLVIPAYILILAYLFWVNLVWGPNLMICEIEYNLFLMGILSLIFSLLLIVVGWVSNNKYAILASNRVVITTLNLEILLNFLIIFILILSESLSFLQIVSLQSHFKWFIWVFLPIWPILLITFLLETGRIPFDLAEAESELIAGFTVEFGGFFFALFYLGEYFHLYCFSVTYVLCFFGGWY